MRTIYVDLVELDQSGALGLISSKVRILPAGAVIRTEQAEIRAEVPRYQEMAERAGVFFFFEDEELPELPFFAVPGLELAARDRDGNWYGRSEALGEGVYCVTPEGTAFRVSEDMGRFSSRLLAGETISKIPPPFCYLLLYSVLHLQVQYIIVVPYCQGQE